MTNIGEKVSNTNLITKLKNKSSVHFILAHNFVSGSEHLKVVDEVIQILYGVTTIIHQLRNSYKQKVAKVLIKLTLQVKFRGKNPRKCIVAHAIFGDT